jgi:glycosyltransferase involved in cell wall biosynthesis
MTLPFVAYLFLLMYPGKKRIIKPDTLVEVKGISIIVPCFNEEKYIENKINEILTMCSSIHPICFELIIITDGSTDSTNEILNKYSTNRNIKLFEFSERKGKPSALNFGVFKAQYDILVFSDVRQRIQNGSLNALLSHFSDTRVGAVSAKIEHVRTSKVRNVINYLKVLENKVGSTIGVYGAFYAIRKNNYIAIPVNTILDDLLISLNVLSQGKLVMFEPKAVVLDIEIEKFYNKKRTLRLINGLSQLAFAHITEILNLSLKDIFFLFFQKYFKLTLPFIISAIPILAFLSDGPYSFKFQIICILWAFLTIMLLFLSRGKSIVFIARMIYFYILSFNPYKSNNTVFWDK